MKWREPKTVRQWRYKQFKEERKIKPRSVAFSFIFLNGIFMLRWFIAHFNLKDNPLPLKDALLIALGGSAFMTFLLFWLIPWMYSLAPYTAVLYADKIKIMRAEGAVEIKASDITECVITSVMTNDGAMPLLVINTSKKAGIKLGILPEMVSEVTNTLASIGVIVTRI